MDSMSPTIDELLTRLRYAASDRRLEQIEPLVWARIGARRASAGILWNWRASLVAAALAVGAVVGGAAAARPASEFALFSTHADLAPSTLLEFAR